ncbi:MAG TPA: sulfite exporter TauE/SafE family protein, partial [Thermoleophilaceae bacterium]|nr:sulfite exporter TauE/SafE family protein [Thermoleophilaceae bacterium]
LIAFGLGVGVLVGMTGIGGGSLMTPMLILVFGTAPITAIGTDLAYAAVTKTVGGYKHWRQKTVDMQLSMWMAVGSVPAAVGGVYVLTLLEKWAGRDFEDLLLEILAVALLLTGAATLVRAFLKRMHERERDTIEMELRHKIAAVVLGVCVGFVLGITSAGSGALIAVGLILLFRLSPTRVVGTDVFHAAILLWAAGLAHIVAGNVDFFLAANILIGSVPGVWLGSHWSVRVQPGVLRATLALVLIGAGLALLIKAGLDVPVWILVPFPLGVIALMVVTMLRARAARAARATLEAREAALAAAAAHTPKRASTPPVGGRAGP